MCYFIDIQTIRPSSAFGARGERESLSCSVPKDFNDVFFAQTWFLHYFFFYHLYCIREQKLNKKHSCMLKQRFCRLGCIAREEVSLTKIFLCVIAFECVLMTRSRWGGGEENKCAGESVDRESNVHIILYASLPRLCIYVTCVQFKCDGNAKMLYLLRPILIYYSLR